MKEKVYFLAIFETSKGSKGSEVGCEFGTTGYSKINLESRNTTKEFKRK